MKKLSMIMLLLVCVANFVSAQIPIVYYDFENNAARATFQNVVEMSLNTAPAGSVFTYVTSAAGACNTIGCSSAQGIAGAGQEHGGTIDGSTLTVGAWNQATADPGISSPSYYQFVVNTSGFNGISLTFDTKYGNGNAPDMVGALISSNGSTWTFVGSSATPNGNTIPVKPGNNAWSAIMANFNLTAASAIANNNATLYIRIYGYNATGGGASAYLSLDNVTILATSTVAGKVFTTMDESNYYTGYTSGLTGATLGRNSFTATGAGTNATINATSGLKMNSGQTFGMTSSATVTFGSAGVLSGAGGILNIASGCSLITSNAGGIPASVTTTGANAYTAGANYTFNASTSTPFPTGTFGSPANVTINPGPGSTITLNIDPTITGILAFTNGKLAIGSRTLTLNGTLSGTSSANVITGGAASNLSIGGSAALGSLFLDQSIDGTTNNIATFILNRTSSGTVVMGNKLVSGTSCALTNGKLLMNGQSLVLNGTFSGSATGSLVGMATSSLTVGGSGALGTLFFDQTTPGTTNAVAVVTLNRVSSGIATLGNAISIGSGGLNLTNGTLADGGNVIALAGNITGTGAHSGSGKISMNAGSTTISSVSLGNLDLNNAGGFSLVGSPSIGGTLTFSSGKLTIGANNLVLGLAAAISGTPSSSSMIVANSTGQVRKLFSSNGSFLYPIGDNSNYTPITLNFTGGVYAVGAYCAVNVKTVKHPNNANVSNYINRYWPVVTSGITGPVYAVTAAMYVPGDVSGSEASISGGQYTGALPWIKFGAANTGAHTISSSSVTNTSFDFTGISTAPPSVTSSANSSLCVGGSTTLTASGGAGDPVLTYYWAPAIGLSSTVGASVTATPLTTTTYTLTITDGNGFAGTATTTITVNSPPSISDNTTGICIGANNTLTGSPTGGTWESSDLLKATVNATGIVSGVSTGTATITYTASPGCLATTEVTVLPLPSAITGSTSVCTGGTTSLGHLTAGGTWFSSDITKATINTSGVVSGLLAGTSSITYTVPSGCTVTIEVAVQPVPVAITGVPDVCIGGTTTLGHPAGGGTWLSSDAVVASINSSGVVSGLVQGTATITYTVPAGCITSLEVTVNPLPALIGGTGIVCEDATITLTNADAGGTWNCFPITTASINSLGVLTGIAAGNANVIYTLPTGCSTSKIVTVNSAPAAISGPSEVCLGQTISLSNITPGGTWSSSESSVASVDVSGIVLGVLSGIADISYTLVSGCSTVNTVTVNSLPATISGALHVCVNGTTTLSDADGGGTWSSLQTTIAIGTATGIVTGMSDGTATVTYTLPTGCTTVAEVTVDPLPAAIAGANDVCENGTISLSNTTTGGSWSSSAAVTATVNVATGEVTGIAAGVADILYTLSTGCLIAVQVTVDPLPAAIAGTPQVCHGSMATLTNSSPGGTWESDVTGIATIDAGGNIDGVSPGIANITYALPTGCRVTKEVTVNALPVTITGPSAVCVNSSVSLVNTDVGGTWGSAELTINVNAFSGVITGVSPGTATITYTLSTGCTTSMGMTVHALPATIGGPMEVCEASSITLTDADPGGTWGSADMNVLVGSGTGSVDGIAAGTATITYTLPTTCAITTIVTVNSLPSVATGATQTCVGQMVTLGSLPTGGTWSSLDIAIVTVGAGGSVSGLAYGTATITYTLPTGCRRLNDFTVNSLPASITGTVPVCENQSTLLDNITPGGSWSSSAPGNATVSAAGLLTGISWGNATVSYTLPTGCYETAPATVNPVPDAITGIAVVCEGLSTTLNTPTSGGGWSSGSDPVAIVDASGTVVGVVAGMADISYTLGTGCYAIRTVTVNQLPAAIIGNANVCEGLSTALTSLPSGGTWMSNNTGVAAAFAATGVVSGIVAGTTDITYTLPTGCIATTTVTVDPLPAPITGTTVACAGQSMMLDDIDAGGTWNSGNTVVATVDAAGAVTAVSSGNAVITYMLPTGCITTTVFTTNPLPTPFIGIMQVCEGLTTTLNDALTGGTWTSGDAGIADITVSGVVSGVSAGTADITYTLPTGCFRSQVATVHPAVPAITGSAVVCKGLNTTLANTFTGGVWISENTTAATIDVFSGVASGINAGTSRISYAMPTGCLNSTIVTVNPLPAAISGGLNVCAGLSTVLNNTTPGGTWSGGASGIATISTSGLVSSISAGTAAFTYMLATGCLKSVEVNVNPLPIPQAVTGGGSYCTGGTGVHIGLANSEPGITYRLYRGTVLTGTQAGMGAPVDFGMYIVVGTYSVKATVTGTGCVNNMTGTTSVSVTPHVVPSVLLYSDHGDTVCGGTSVTFTATSVNGGLSPLYEWSVNSTSSIAASSFVYTPVSGDTIKVRLSSSEACALPATVLAKKKMNVITNQTPTININKTSGDTLCKASIAAFHANAAWGGNAPVYTWRKNGTDVGSGIDFSYLPSNGDVISCKLTSNYRCRLATAVTSNNVTLHVDSTFIPDVTINANPGLTIAPYSIATLTATVTGAGSAPVYVWQLNGVTLPWATGAVYANSFNDNDIVTCVVYGTGPCGLPSFNSVTIKVVKGAGVEPVVENLGAIKLMPNPNTGVFTVEGNVDARSNDVVMLEVTNMLGQVVYSENVKLVRGRFTEQINVGKNLAGGVYILSIISGGDRKMLPFIVKE